MLRIVKIGGKYRIISKIADSNYTYEPGVALIPEWYFYENAWTKSILLS